MKIVYFKHLVLLVNDCFCYYRTQKLRLRVRLFAFYRPLRFSKVSCRAPSTQMPFQTNSFEKRRVAAQKCHLSQITFDSKAFETLV